MIHDIMQEIGGMVWMVSNGSSCKKKGNRFQPIKRNWMNWKLLVGHSLKESRLLESKTMAKGGVLHLSLANRSISDSSMISDSSK
jgi:hypothetical protein